MRRTPFRRLALATAVIGLAAFAMLALPARETGAAEGTWTARFYNNLTLSGSPVGGTSDLGPTLDYVWGGSPKSDVNADNWSASFERSDAYAAGTYRFTVTGDDGVRIFVDGALILDAWVDQPPTTYFTDLALTAGGHTVRVELYDVGNAATVIVSIQDVAAIPPGWQGEYFANQDLAGTPARTRNDGEDIAFEWNSSKPGSPFPGVIPNDGFSARWTRTLDFNEGVYQFTTLSDDGVRVFVDGQKILDYWVDQPPTEHFANKQLSAGPHTVVVEYFENGGGASMFLTIGYRPDLGGFVEDVIVSGQTSDLNAGVAFAFAPDGRIFIAEKDGSVRIFEDGTLLATDYYTVAPVNDYEDRGLLGVALDPNFAQNGFVYLAYTYDNNPANPSGPKTNQVIRVNANTPSGNVANPASKVVLLGTVTGNASKPSCEQWPLDADCIPVDHLSHAIGNIKFGPDGMLYVATGDGASYNTVDQRALRAIDVDRLAGKILRVDPASGEGLPDNPFWNGDADATRSKVWALGFRNDFRFNFKPGTDTIYSGDVGWNDWEEIDVVKKGQNYGWPCYEGSGQQPGYAAYAACQALYGAGTAKAPLIEWEHPPDAAAVGPAFTGVNGYPSRYQDTWFFGDYARGQISTFRVDTADALVPDSVLPFTASRAGPVQIEVGPEGDVYYMALYYDGDRNALINELRRIRFVGDNRPPVAAAAANPTSGIAPLNVSFSSAGSTDPDAGQAITYEWDFGDGSPPSSSANPSHTYAADGTYTAALTVTDPLFLTDVASVQIQVGNEPPVVTIDQPSDGGRYDVGDTISFSGSATDPQDGDVPPVDLQWTIKLVHCSELALVNCHDHTVTTASGTGGSFPAIDHGDFTYYSLTLTAEDSAGLTGSRTITVTPNRVDLSVASNRPGIQIVIDSDVVTVPHTRSVPRNSQHVIFAQSPQTVGADTWYFSSWSDGGDQQHAVILSADATLTADFDAATATPTATATATPTPTSTPTPSAPDTDGDGLSDADEATYGTDPNNPDTDGDRCRDGAEVGPDPTSGGGRNPLDAWDFFDVQEVFGTVDLSDTIFVLSHFGHGHNDDPTDPTLDRIAPDPERPWLTAPATNGVDLDDALNNLVQFGHGCG